MERMSRVESVSLASRHGDEFPPLRRHDGHLFLENFIQHAMCSDSFGRTTMWIFTSVTSAVCSSLSAMPTHTLASSVLASPSVFDRGHIVPRLAAAGRGVLAILATKWVSSCLLGKVCPKSCSLSCSLATSDGPRFSYSVASFALDNS